MKNLPTLNSLETNVKPKLWDNNFGSSSLEFQVYFWTERVWRIENIKSELRFAVDAAFRENNITIAFPQMDIHVKSGFDKQGTDKPIGFKGGEDEGDKGMGG